MSWPSLSRGDWIVILAGSLLVTLSYPPFHLIAPSFVCLIPLAILWQRAATADRPLERSLVVGFTYGVVSNALLLYWIVVALWRLSPLSAFGYIGTLAALGGWQSVAFATGVFALRRLRTSPLVVIPVVWTAYEWSLAWLGDLRFPWLGLGNSLSGYVVLIQLAELVGVRGLTLLLAIANVTILLAWQRRRDRRTALRLVGPVVLGVVAAAAYGGARIRTLEIRPLGTVAVVQPNVGYLEKWDVTRHDSIVRTTVALSASVVARWRPDLVVWPEGAIPADLDPRPEWESLIRTAVKQDTTPLVFGGFQRVPRSGGSDFFNSAFVLDEVGGRVPPVYHKRYLVPMVEHVPWTKPNWSSLRWFGSFSEGAASAAYAMSDSHFGLLICFEAVFADLSRSYRQQGADFVVNITNDAWFGSTTAPYQHASHVVMRAVENRMGVVRAANSGISMYVDPFGRTQSRTQLGERTAVADTVWTSDARTLYTRAGDWVGGGCALMALLMVGYSWVRARP